MSKNFIFSSESVGEGHPDKVCDTISDAVLDACLAQDPRSRVACETYAKSNLVVIGGEITTRAKLDYNAIAREAIREIGYVNDDDVFHADRVLIMNAITSQSADIAQGVDAKAAEGKDTDEQGAGDQGLMFGYACNETPELMPAPIMYAHQLGRELTRIRKSGKVAWLRPDAKSQVSVQYENGKPVRITNVVISTQHAEDVKHKEIKDFIIKEVIRKVLPAQMLDKKTQFLINPTGRFVVGGPQGDTGLTGRKIIVDSYGGMGRHGGGAFSGKDPSKVDRSAAYMGRYVAKNIVASGLATCAEIQFAYAIGHPDPVSVCVNTFGTGAVSDEAIEKAVREVFSFKPAAIVKQLNLLRPIYSKTTNYGHFGKVDDTNSITWEKTDKAAALKRAAK
ncbi:methionine adenosyltransferase [Pedosphaera parvula]|uniref:S-adenosylmethionine synthase n=1 Tax=Pedosphaera parvula (strain Ellin514) TaxID=320771 RepID=B9XT54_PEDPL|nr:methionine adenosyltransferase [Pedosphaera parvula]EEF56978.1 Methionine adenosyltransferase [Pedosphaera parvula Ellin514]